MKGIILLLISTSIIAKTYKLEDIIVTDKLKRKKSELFTNTQIIDSKQIEQASSVKEVLNKLSDIHINENSGVSYIYQRGLGAGYNLVLIDGIRANDNTGISTNFDFSLINKNSIERIEIIRGLKSSVYGNNAIGSVINIITKSYDKNKVYVSKGFKDIYGASVSSLKGNLSYHISSSYEEDNSRSVYFNDGEKDTFIKRDIKTKINYKDHSLVFGNYNNFNQTDPQDEDNPDTYAKNKAFYYNLSLETDKLSYKIGHFQNDRSNKYKFLGFQKSSFYSTEDQADINYKVENSLFGVQLNRSKAITNSANFEEDTYAPYMYINKKLSSFELGLSSRYQVYKNRSPFLTYGLELGRKFDLVDFEISMQKGFKAPSMYELYDKSAGNETLKSETIHSYTLSTLFKVLFNPKLSLFKNELEDKIAYRKISPTKSQYQNSSSYSISGVELSSSYKTNRYEVVLSSSFTKIDSKEDSHFQGPHRYKYSLTNSYHANVFDINSSIVHVSDRRDFSGKLDPYTLVNLGIFKKVRDNLNIEVLINNIFDEDYELTTNQVELGRNYLAKLMYTY
ncbi:MAG: TonB-dependent receptor [Bacteriovoracaceae bacterium]|jgi:outer membrane cobalamin receptor|nr:TonB-dependent receptor [Bacteriovoracaceae bacterium]